MQVKKLTDAVFNGEVRAKTHIQTNVELNRFYLTVATMFDILIDFYEHSDNKATNLLNKLLSIKNDLTLFTFACTSYKHMTHTHITYSFLHLLICIRY